MLYVTALPIDGDWKTLDPRVVDCLKKADLLVAEERRNALRLLAAADAREREFILVNEHTTEAERLAAAEKIVSAGVAVFVSDAGTPCIADPDWKLVRLCIELGVEIKSLPGPSSITAALSISGFDVSRFIFLGFPPRDKKERVGFFKALGGYDIASVFLERPYSLEQTLGDMAHIKKQISVCLSLGMQTERTFRGLSSEILPKVKGVKEPFCIVVNKS